jgi:hypothetical protein
MPRDSLAVRLVSMGLEAAVLSLPEGNP